MENIERKENFKQVCVIQGLLLRDENNNDYTDEFIKFVNDKFGVRIQVLEAIVTLPNKDPDGKDVEETGGRYDVFFAVHNEDVGKFTIPRFQLNARWIEDVLAECNYHSPIYPKRVFDYCTWNEDALSRYKDDPIEELSAIIK